MNFIIFLKLLTLVVKVIYFNIQSDKKMKLPDIKDIIYKWRELVFLICGFFPTFYWCKISYQDTQIYFCDYSKRYLDSELFCRNNEFFDIFKRISVERIDWATVFKKWGEIREKTGVTIDMFFSSIYAKGIYQEFYPFQMVACIDGFVNGYGLLAHKEVKPKMEECINCDYFPNKERWLGARECIKKIVSYDETKAIFRGDREFKRRNNKEAMAFIEKMLNHRNWLAHAKTDYENALNMEENCDAATELMTLLRIVILKETGIEIIKFNLEIKCYTYKHRELSKNQVEQT